MRSILSLGILLVLTLTAGAQNGFPPVLGTQVDAYLEEAYAALQKKDTATTHRAVRLVDEALATLGDTYPTYRGIIRLFQSFYTFNPAERERYRTLALPLVGGGGRALADTFSLALHNVMQLHYKAGRMAEWRPADSVFRSAIAGAPVRRPAHELLNYAITKLHEKQYAISRNIATYDYYTTISRPNKDAQDRYYLMHNDWLITKGDLEQWKEMDYEFRYPEEFKNQSGTFTLLTEESKASYQRLRAINFQSILKTLLSRMQELTRELVTDNPYGSPGFRADWRQAYYQLYAALLVDYYAWAVAEHKESIAIVPFKEFLYNDLIPNEIKPAAQAGRKPAIKVTTLITLFRHLADLFHRVGNGHDEEETALRGMGVLLDHKQVYSQAEQDYALLTLYPARASADRLLQQYDASLKRSQSLKKFAPRPDSATTRHTEQWEAYMQARIEEVYTLLAADRRPAARDSFATLMGAVAPLDDGSDFAPLYKMKAWPHFQYLAAIMQAWTDKWDPSLLRESLMDMDRLDEQPEIYYPVQLFYFKATWRAEKKLSEALLSNLLFYTGRQLRHTYPMLSAEERMRLFEQKLSPFFDVYHELLFGGHLDAHPQLREKVIAQSLSIKNALADGNLIPNELLESGQDASSRERIEKLRALRQEINLFVQQGRLKTGTTGERRVLHDRVQNMWLSLLEDSGMDSLSKLTDWRRITRSLRPGQVYTEVIRYNRWLSDSAAYYGACVLSADGRLAVVPLFAEKALNALLHDPAASPQTVVLAGDGNRGGILLPKEKPAARTYRPGDPDRLAALLLQPLWPHLQGKSDWLLVQDGLLNRISFAALLWKGKNLFEHLQLSQLTSSYSLFQPETPLPAKGEALLVGGLHYGDPATPNTNRLFKPNYYWNYLPGTRKEVQALQARFTAAGYRPRVLTGAAFPDSAVAVLKNYPIIHLATHGFYLDSTAAAAVYSDQWNEEAVQYEPLFRCGIAVSGANEPDEKGSNEGYLLGYELANVDLRACYLVSLSACETGLGDVRNNLGVDGLSRALKLSGARHLLISLWKVPDTPTAVFMEQFYKHLFSGQSPAQALRSAQAFMSRSYPATDWAAFVLVK